MEHLGGDATAAWQLRRGPLLVTAALSVATVIVFLPYWVAAAAVCGAAGIVATRSPSRPAHARATMLASLALGSSVGPVVYLLLTAIITIAR